MKALTKSGIRELNAKYRSILRKCLLINCLILTVSVGAMADDAGLLFSTNYDEFVAQLESDEPLLGTLDKRYGRPELPQSTYTLTKVQEDGNFSITFPDKNGNQKIYQFNIQPKTPTVSSSDSNGVRIQDFSTQDSVVTIAKDASYDYVIGDVNNNNLEADSVIYNVGKIKNFTGTVFNNNTASVGVLRNQGEIDSLIGDFLGNKAVVGTVYNTKKIGLIQGLFINNETRAVEDGPIAGGAIHNGSYDVTENSAYIGKINADFIANKTAYDGAAILNSGLEDTPAIIQEINGDFISNAAMSTSGNFGGAIYNGAMGTNSQIITLNGNFTGNYVESYMAVAGALYNSSTAYIGRIQGDFKQNYIKGEIADGGAIYNSGRINLIVGDFVGNHVIYSELTAGEVSGGSLPEVSGGAILNDGTISILTGNFIANYINAGEASASGGAIYNHNNAQIDLFAVHGQSITFDGNYLISEDKALGGAIYNASRGTVGLHAVAENDRITFVGGEEEGKQDIDGIYNVGTLNINGDGNNSYQGTVNLYNVDGRVGEEEIKGETNIYGGKVFANGQLTQSELYIQSGYFVANSELNINNLTINSGYVEINSELNLPADSIGMIGMEDSVLVLNKESLESLSVHPFEFHMTDSTLNLQNNSIGNLIIKGNQSCLQIHGNNNLLLDADLANEQMDQIEIWGYTPDNGIFNISDIRLLSDANQDIVLLDLFADNDSPTKELLHDKVYGHLTGLRYGPIYTYDADYNKEDGKVTFTRTQNINPYIYAPITVAQTTATMTEQIATIAMNALENSSTNGQGLSAGDLPKTSNAWVKVVGFDDDVGFNHFNTIDSKTLTIAGGFNTDKVTFNSVDAAFGIYAGYIHGKQKYTGNKIEQDGGYIGLSSEVIKGNTFLLSTLNAGFINNEAQNMYGTDKFDTRWLGVGLKGGYNYVLTDSWTLQPNVYAGYTFVNTEDYTSKSGVKVNTNNLNFFEIDPGFKLSKQIDTGWLGFIQGKYAIVMDNGGDTKANEIALPNISQKNYFEYGIGMEKSLTDVWSLNGLINRRDGGRTGWNGSVEFKYNF